MDPILTVENVSRNFGHGHAEVLAVKDVSFSVTPGEIVLIMGPSGSGKTTLLSMLGGLLKPTSGHIRIGQEDLTLLTENQLPNLRLRHIGFIFQDFNLLSALSCLDNVSLVAQLSGISRNESRRRAQDILEQLGMGHRLKFQPEKLSGGEKQRVAIARAIINDPDLILADEPTANLDSHHGHEIMRLLRRLARDAHRSVVIVSHDERLKDIADRVLWMEDGTFKKLVEMAVDPVCGMSVDRDISSIHAQYEGQTYYFCAPECREEFLETPDVFLNRKENA